MANNHAFIKGNLTHDPTFDYLEGRNGEGVVPFMRLNVAVDRESASGADFFQVVAYGKQALHDHAFLRRGIRGGRDRPFAYAQDRGERPPENPGRVGS